MIVTGSTEQRATELAPAESERLLTRFRDRNGQAVSWCDRGVGDYRVGGRYGFARVRGGADG